MTPAAEPLAGLEAELAVGHELLKIRRRPRAALDIGQHGLVDRERQIGADEIRILEWAQHCEATPNAALITVSTVSASQMPCSTSETASRQSACCNRLPMKPGTSFLTCAGVLPAVRCSVMVHSMVWSEVHCVPITSTSGTR